jgi:hypothetical protein
MQQGSVIPEHRKLGPDVWCFRWWESGPSGNRVHRRIVLGTAEQKRDASSARLITAGLVQEINATDIRLAGISASWRYWDEVCSRNFRIPRAQGAHPERFSRVSRRMRCLSRKGRSGLIT